MHPMTSKLQQAISRRFGTLYLFHLHRRVDLRTNSDLCHLQHELIGFYNRDENCLQRGTDWVFKCFVFI
jgi:hypothetical protein